MKKNNSRGLEKALIADGPFASLCEELKLFGQFIGDWHSKIVTYSSDGSVHRGTGEIRFGWILEGRAIQDVWTIPPIGEKGSKTPPLPVAGNWYGTTIRTWDPDLSAWRIFWIDPATNTHRLQIGKRVGKDIVQEGQTETGMLSRWIFTDISTDSFHWKAEGSQDGGKMWRLLVEVFAQRLKQ